MGLSNYNNIDGIYFLTPKTKNSTTDYVIIRKKEGRLLTDEQVKILPNLNKYEWSLRKKSTQRFVNYIKQKNEPLEILNIGCGNGWFSNKIAEISNKNNIIGLDINEDELRQATRIFKLKNLKFVHASIFENINIFKNNFDVITLNGSVQYFPNFKVLFQTLQLFLKPKGEIHIIDSPFYQPDQIIDAKDRTLAYYTKLGFPEMAENYYHHETSHVSNFDVLYKYQKKIINRIIGKKDSPFSWYRYVNKQIIKKS